MSAPTAKKATGEGAGAGCAAEEGHAGQGRTTGEGRATEEATEKSRGSTGAISEKTCVGEKLHGGVGGQQ